MAKIVLIFVHRIVLKNGKKVFAHRIVTKKLAKMVLIFAHRIGFKKTGKHGFDFCTQKSYKKTGKNSLTGTPISDPRQREMTKVA